MTTSAGFFTMFTPAAAAPPAQEQGAPLLRQDQAPREPRPFPPYVPASTRHTLAELLEVYTQEYLPSLAPRTQHATRLLYARWLPTMGHLLLTDLTPAFLRQWRDTLSARYSAATVNRYLAALSAPLTSAVKDLEWLRENPMWKIRKRPEPLGRIRFLSDDERHRLLQACSMSRNPHVYTLTLLAITTGARKNEMLQLHWRDVDLEQGLLRLNTTKNKERRSVPVRGEALLLLRRQSREQPPEAWVFARWDKKAPSQLEGSWQRAKRRAKLVDFRFHDLRHTAASYLAATGATLHEISTILGHRSLKMTMKYAHLTTGHTGAVIERMVQQKLGAQEESLYARPR